jgi:SAM-dependent methyltransferase
VIDARMQKRFYPDLLGRDPVARFVHYLYSHLKPGQNVVDLGAGAGLKNVYSIRGRVGRIVGIDLDPRVRINPLIDVGIVSDICSTPCESCSFDVAFSVYVLEHIASAEQFAGEVRRILRPGGVFLALTPNRWHYVPLVSALTPTAFHRWLNRRRGRHEDDTFATYYRMNTREVQPNYLCFSVPTYLAGVLYERIVNATDLFSAFRVNIIGAFRKK